MPSRALARLFFMERYSQIHEKRPREIVLLRGRGCAYRKCPFCDYHLDSCSDGEENFALNQSVLSRVTGKFHELEVINSGSVFELDEKTLALLRTRCAEKHITVLHFESHYLYEAQIPALRKAFAPVTLKMKLGLETFDYDFRETVLKKGIPVRDPQRIAKNFDEANFLFGIRGQTKESMERDLELGLTYFERICVNLMCENSTPVKPDKAVISLFLNELYPRYRENERVDILIDNLDFGVGA